MGILSVHMKFKWVDRGACSFFEGVKYEFADLGSFEEP